MWKSLSGPRGSLRSRNGACGIMDTFPTKQRDRALQNDSFIPITEPHNVLLYMYLASFMMVSLQLHLLMPCAGLVHGATGSLAGMSCSATELMLPLLTGPIHICSPQI